MNPIKAFREAHTPPLSQEDLAGRIGVTRFAVLRWEAGNPPDVKVIPRLSEVTGIPPSVLRPDLASMFGVAS